MSPGSTVICDRSITRAPFACPWTCASGPTVLIRSPSIRMPTPDCGASDRPSMSRPALMRSGGAVWAGGGACAQAGVATASVANKTKPRCIGPPSGARRISLCSSPCQDVRQGRRLSHLRRAVPQKRPSAGARAASFLRHADANQGGSMDAGRLPMGELVYGRERVLFAVMLLVSPLLYGSLVTLALSDASTGGVFLFYGVLLAFGGFVAHAFALGRIRGNGVLVTERQFPFLQQMVNAHARQLGLTYSPTVYVLESGGILNAFATSCLGGSSSSSMRTSSPWRCGADTRP